MQKADRQRFQSSKNHHLMLICAEYFNKLWMDISQTNLIYSENAKGHQSNNYFCQQFQHSYREIIDRKRMKKK